MVLRRIERQQTVEPLRQVGLSAVDKLKDFFLEPVIDLCPPGTSSSGRAGRGSCFNGILVLRVNVEVRMGRGNDSLACAKCNQ